MSLGNKVAKNASSRWPSLGQAAERPMARAMASLDTVVLANTWRSGHNEINSCVLVAAWFDLKAAGVAVDQIESGINRP
ncbi:MAG: hypothetical protein OXG65_14310 [Chloroflexi bacterium]|nr:hypothetical protein [Chloroflexota bacterium]